MERQPFYIGQQVICIIDASDRDHPKKDMLYTVLKMEQCSNCKRWIVGYALYNGKNKTSKICLCKYEMKPDGYWGALSSVFAPVERTKTKYVIKEVEIAPQIREMEVQLS